MLPAERRKFILDALEKNRKVIASELSDTLQVSEDTIRRDLDELSQAGLLQRVHGGALPSSPATAPYSLRQQQFTEAKAAIAAAAAELVRPGQVVIFDGGTTTDMVARRLSPDLQATVITNSPPVAITLSGHPHIEVILTGGRLLKPSLTLTGAPALESLSNLRADLCFLGVCSLHPDVGVSVPDHEESFIKRKMIDISAEVVALVSAEKLGTASPYVVGPLQALTHLITEKNLPEEILSPYRLAGLTVIEA